MSDTKNKTDFEKSMLILESDVDALGWDQPARLYAVLGDSDDDLRFEFMAAIEDHPVDYMRSLVQTGRFEEFVKGVALVTEGWRHPSFKEFQEEEEFPLILHLGRLKGLNEDEALQAAERAFDFANSQIPPSRGPFRKEIRNVLVVMRDGRMVGVHRDRGHDAELIDGVKGGRVDMAMASMLTGTWDGRIDK